MVETLTPPEELPRRVALGVDSPGVSACPRARPSAPVDRGLNAVAGVLDRLAQEPATAAPDVADELAVAAVEQALPGLPGVAGHGVTLLRDGVPRSVRRDVARFTALEDVQYAGGVGPVPLALREHRAVLVDATAGRTWPPYATCAAELGVRSCLVVPLSAGDEVLGSLNLYATDPAGDLDVVRPVARLAADLASTALAALARQAAMTKLTEELRTALESRAVIEQAKGLLMARGRDDGEAFALLRRLSQNHNIKLREVAALVVDLG
ncbi:GAF and ANTAR domain-containing protein [Actinomycetospora lutea]|uniref:GAF and ANTAR domain-containing protein n=1 Tax=Actinomycetospora lutea TaxID=663604 RepID=UPI002365BFE5|nr:GAF and ANTAR domain-containing protein [Actinomycetospora lutea]MDD7938425.1 GAF and ANTAR domain-containing protein [Actinomycetospora lutea]